MKNFSKLLLPAILLALFAGSCNKEEDPIDPMLNPGMNDVVEQENSKFEAIMPVSEITVNLVGTILDESGIALSGATVTAGGQTTTTDQNGVFFLNETLLNDKFARIKAEKSGYIDGFKTYTPTQSSVNYIRLMLMEEGNTVNLDAITGGTLTIDNDINLDFPPNCIVNSNGTLYSGTVKVSGRYIDPKDENLTSIMPGMLVGLSENSDFESLISYGMMAIELKDENGNELQIAKDQSVEVDLPASDDGPESMPFWHFNEKNGLWIEAGVATKEGDRYIASANDFSYWNVDFPYTSGWTPEVDILELYFLDENSEPIVGLIVGLSYLGNDLYIFQTDEGGKATLVGVPPTMILEWGICENSYEESVSAAQEEVFFEINLAEIGARRVSLTGLVSGCDEAGNFISYNNATAYMLSPNPQNDTFFFFYTDNEGFYFDNSLICLDFDEYIYGAILFGNGGNLVVPDIVLAFPEGEELINLDIDYCQEEVSELEDEFPIPFQDTNFEQAIKILLGIPTTEPVTYGDIKNVTTLTLAFEGIFNISGIQFFNSLTSLDLTTNSIIDISALGALEDITSLNIDNNMVADISPLSQLINLDTLIMPINNVSDLSPLAGLSNLLLLDFSYNVVEDISPISGLINLKYVDGSGNIVSDVASMNNLSNLEEWYFAENAMISVPDLSNMSSLLHLDFRANSIVNILGISNMPALETLDFRNNQLQTISALSSINSLTFLDMGNNSLSDLSPLSGLTGLTNLRLNNNFITDLQPLSTLTGLNFLGLNANSISDVVPLCGLGAAFTGEIELSNNSLNAADFSALGVCLPGATITP